MGDRAEHWVAGRNRVSGGGAGGAGLPDGRPHVWAEAKPESHLPAGQGHRGEIARPECTQARERGAKPDIDRVSGGVTLLTHSIRNDVALCIYGYENSDASTND